jgi:hypothetical protein
MANVRYSECTETGVHQFVTEASDIGLGVGTWPEKIETDMGNGLPFVRVSAKRDNDGDIQWVTYRQANGCLDLKVFND